jgi:hypothetical protein
MNVAKLITLLCLFLALSAPAFVKAEEEAEKPAEEFEAEEYDEDEDEDQALMPSPDVTTSYIFPEHKERSFPLGEIITVLVGISNVGHNVFNITNVGGHLHSPFDFNYYIQNFTVKEIASEVDGESQISVEYKFMADPSLEPLEFWFSGWVEYNSTDGEGFRSTFVNGTVDLVSAPVKFDPQLFFKYILIFAVLGVVVYTGGTQIMAKAGGRKKFESGTKGADDGWGEVRVYKPSEGSKSARKRKGAKKE